MAEKLTHEELETRIQELEEANLKYKLSLVSLQERLKQHEFLTEQTLLPVVVVQGDKVVYANNSYSELTGYPLEQILKWRIEDTIKLIHPDYREFVISQARKKMGGVKAGIVTNYQYKAINRKSEERWIDQYSKTVLYNGKPADMISMIDITESKQATRLLRENEEKYRLLAENVDDVIWRSDLSFNWIYISPSFIKLTGYSSEEAVKIPLQEMITPASAEIAANTLMEELGKLKGSQTNDIVKKVEVEFYCKDGSTVWAEISVKIELDSDGNPTGLLGVTRDISDRKRSETLILESEERFRTLVEQSPLGISLLGSDGHYRYLNPQFTNIFGYTLEDIPTGKKWFKTAFPDASYRQKIINTWIKDLQQAETGQARPRVYTVTCKDGSQKKIHFRPVTMENRDQFVVYEDITEKSRMERHLQQTQKFEAIGTLAGGIAHDFNNLLMGIQGRISLMATDLEPFHAYLEHTNAIEKYVRRATDLTRQLLGLARGGKYEIKPTSINDLVRNSAKMFGRTKKEIKIHTNLADPQPVVMVDRNQIEQVLLNVYINAWQAMPGGGELYLETRIVTLNDADCRPYHAKAGNYAKASVTDTGVGMDAATQQQIFDPFFTTKEKDRGTGLGLASAYGIVKNHDGIIIVNSKIGFGTTFDIYLPLSDKKAYREVSMEKKLIKGSETVLLVDDEEMILEVGRAMFEKLGYRVIVAEGGKQAVDVINKQGAEIDLVILDLIMPGVDGSQVFDHIKKTRPLLPIILSSGYAINGQADKIMQRGCNGFIQKPFNLFDLSKRVKQILDDSDNL